MKLNEEIICDLKFCNKHSKFKMNFLKNELEQGLSSNLSSGDLQFHHKKQRAGDRQDEAEDDTAAKIIAVVYNSGFCCFQCPFSLKFDRRKGKYCIEKRSNFFIVVYVLIQLALMGTNLYMLQGEWIAKLYTFDDFTRKYTAIMSWLWILSLVNFSWTLLRGQTRIQTSVNAIHETCQSLLELGVSIPKKTQIEYPAMFFVLYFFVWTAFDVITDFGTYVQNVSWTEDYGAIYAAVLQNAMLIVGELGRLTTHFIDILCLTHAYIVYVIFVHFVNHLTADKGKETETGTESQENSTVVFNRVFDTLDQLSKLSDALESAIGRVISCLCFCLLPYYTLQVQNVFKNFEKSFSHGFRTVLMVATLVITLALAAEANLKMNYVISWIQLKSADRRKRESLSEKLDMQEKIGIILNQIQRNQIGLRAKFYTVTYGFIGSIIGLLLTYSVMITQLQSVDVTAETPL